MKSIDPTYIKVEERGRYAMKEPKMVKCHISKGNPWEGAANHERIRQGERTVKHKRIQKSEGDMA